MDNFGEYLREKRLVHGETLASLGNKLNVTRQYISMLELNKQRTPPAIVDNLVLLLDMDKWKAHKLNGTVSIDLHNKFVEYQDVLFEVTKQLDSNKKKFTQVMLKSVK